MNHYCVLCGSMTTLEWKRSADELASSFSQYFNNSAPMAAFPIGYRMSTCTGCGLGAAEPSESGNAAFYRWITSQPNYYPHDRWEWEPTLEAISNRATLPELKVLDVGCGSGDFLDRLREIRNVRAIGLDMTAESVAECVGRGLEAVCSSMKDFVRENPHLKFDVVTSFHCLEHVEDPLEFTKEILGLLRDSESVAIISAPLSPMSFEAGWVDPLNGPPHHLTKWSENAVRALGNQLGIEVKLTSSPAAGALSRTFRTMMLASHGPAAKQLSFVRKIGFIMVNLPKFISLFRVQARRPSLNGKVAGDTFLAFFGKHFV